MRDGEIQRFDAMQIPLIDFMLPTRLVRFRSAQELAHHAYGAIQHALTRQAQLCAMRFELAPQLRIDQREEDEAWLFGDVVENALQLALASHQRIEMFPNLDLVK